MSIESIGHGIVTPFRRDGKGDFANAGGKTLLRSRVRQVIGVRGSTQFTQGEIPWRTDFGSAFDLLRHRKSQIVVNELGRVYARDAMRWEPHADLTDVETSRLDSGEVEILIIFRPRIQTSRTQTDLKVLEEKVVI